MTSSLHESPQQPLCKIPAPLTSTSRSYTLNVITQGHSAPGSLGHAPPCHDEELVPEVRVAVVEAHTARPRHHPLHDRAEGELRSCREAGQCTCTIQRNQFQKDDIVMEVFGIAAKG